MDRRKLIVWLLAIAGAAASWFKFYQWSELNGYNLLNGWREAFTLSLWGAGFAWDLVAVTLMLVALAIYDRKRLGGRMVFAVIGSMAISVSLGLAFYALAQPHARGQS